MNSPSEHSPVQSNLVIVSNVYPVKTAEGETWDNDEKQFVTTEHAPRDLNETYYQQMKDLRLFRTPDDSCVWLRHHGLGGDKPWAKVRIDGQLVSVCKCDRDDCPSFAKCRPELAKG